MMGFTGVREGGVDGGEEGGGARGGNEGAGVKKGDLSNQRHQRAIFCSLF